MEFKIITFGCKVNQVDSAGMQQQLLQSGMTVAATIAEANLLIVNSCAVTLEAQSKSRRLISRLRRENPDARIIAAGRHIDAERSNRAKRQNTKLTGSLHLSSFKK